MPLWNRTVKTDEIGRRGEALAIRHLRAQGYAIERTNVRFPAGELDIVARDGQTLCFIEVRSRSSSDWGGPLASITAKKRRRTIRAARWYLSRYRVTPCEMRFDVVAIEWHEPQPPVLLLLRGAFEAC